MITGIGILRVNHLIRPVMLRKPTTPATNRPADDTCALVNFLASATAAMAFIGCTGRGMPKKTPVKMLARPAKTRVLDKEM